MAHNKGGSVITFKLGLEKNTIAEQVAPSIAIERINVIDINHDIAREMNRLQHEVQPVVEKTVLDSQLKLELDLVIL
ncbi:hypothetical protein RJ45_11520 [Photobacterium gaetbulicola]|uniref:Uncharacterized protein n=1 Tax=Photobacterium gaetbulicola TaxID=1295392 RepID=A0A0B9G477_9GAMM|nr:hypothetical protein RJ45_11520 [Photobacterium gaetbulicola]